MSSARSFLIVIVGPTGSGKSELSLTLAEKLGGEVISCDSVQLYRRLDIGSAKLPLAERRGIPHHLIDAFELDQEITAGSYARAARQAISSVRERGSIPIVAGGTGFYLRALIDGLSPAPTRDRALRERLEALATRWPLILHRILRRYDPVAARRIHSNDHQKLIRAIELTCLAAQPASQTQNAPRDRMGNTTTLKLGLWPDRHPLYTRLNQRCTFMFEQGLLAETEALLKAGFSPSLKAFQSLGYRQAVLHLAGQLSYKDAVSECQTKTRQYAKRQLTWFRREPDVKWLTGFGTEQSIQQTALELSRQFLQTAAPA